MSDTRLQMLLAAAGEALRELQRYRDELVEAHVPMTQHPKPENIPEREVRADVKRQDRILAQLRRAITLYQPDPTITCKHCRATGGQHYGNCPAATPATMIKGPGE